MTTTESDWLDGLARELYDPQVVHRRDGVFCTILSWADCLRGCCPSCGQELNGLGLDPLFTPETAAQRLADLEARRRALGLRVKKAKSPK